MENTGVYGMKKLFSNFGLKLGIYTFHAILRLVDSSIGMGGSGPSKVRKLRTSNRFVSGKVHKLRGPNRFMRLLERVNFANRVYRLP